MNAVTISPKFQIVIPREVRKFFQISPGEKLQILPYNDRIELIPLRKLKSMRGFLKGTDASVKREGDWV